MDKPYGATFDNQLIELDSVDSTNNYAMARIHEGLATDGMVILAHHQWAGKGQRGKRWESASGQNLCLSLVIKPGGIPLSQQFLISAASSLAVLDLTRFYTLAGFQIKWPNDLYWNDRKAAGILIENVIQGQNWSFAVIGIGMNLNQETFPDDLPNPVSLRQVSGMDYRPVDVARILVPAIQKRIALLRTDPGTILDDFNLSLYKRNGSVLLKKGNESFEARIEGVDSQGGLITDQGRFTLGEIEFVRFR